RTVLAGFTTDNDAPAAPMIDTAHADSPLFAVRADSRILAIANHQMWGVEAASIGVLTHPAYRRSGHGKSVTTAAMSAAFAHGHLVLYRTLLANRASIALAESLGCRDYARFLAVHLRST